MLQIKKKDYEKMLSHCKKELPYEACGLLGGKKEGEIFQVEKIYLLKNTDTSEKHFSMDPKEQIEAGKDMREKGYVLLGNFHSHPKAPALLSDEDKRLAWDSKVCYLVFSLIDRENPVLRAFWVKDENHVVKEEIVYV